jgi:hypothetical protein
MLVIAGISRGSRVRGSFLRAAALSFPHSSVLEAIGRHCAIQSQALSAKFDFCTESLGFGLRISIARVLVFWESQSRSSNSSLAAT